MAVTIVRRVGVFSWAKILGLIYGILGLVIGAFVALISLFGAALGSALASASGDPQRFLPALFGVGAIILMPILYGLIGFVAGLIGAGLYNLVAGMVGGLKLELTSLPEP